MRGLMRTNFAAIFMCASVTGHAGVIGPVEVAPAVATVQTMCLFAGQSSYSTWSGYTSAYDACDRAGTYLIEPNAVYSGNGSSVVVVNATFGPKMQVDVMAYAGSSGTLEDGAYVAAASGAGIITYYFAVEQITETPVPITLVPITYEFWGEAVTWGWESRAWFSSRLGGSLPGLYPYWVAPGNVYSDYLLAGCWTGARWWAGSGYAECQAIADPVFSFDQAAFDELMGSETFGLEQYFSFAFSPNLLPEPGTLTLFGMGLAGLGLGRSRKVQITRAT